VPGDLPLFTVLGRGIDTLVARGTVTAFAAVGP
jgi:hypothetical protein